MTALDPERKRALFDATALPHTTALYNTALRLTGASADASDLVQETFLRAYRTFENFSLGTNCKAWLLTILYSVHINQRKRAQRAAISLPPEELDALLDEDAAGGAGDDERLPELDERWGPEVDRALRDLAEPLRAAILLVDGEDRRGAHASPVRRYLLPAAGVLAAAAVVVILMSRGSRDLPSAVGRDFAAYGRAALSLDTMSGDGPALERYFARRGLAFRTRVFDLGMMGYGLVGARVHQLDGRPSALFAYRGVDDRTLVCQMFEGSLDQLPQGGEAREHNGIEFRIFKEHGLTAVFWMEGSVVCVLVSDAPGEDVVQLAYAKAVKV